MKDFDKNTHARGGAEDAAQRARERSRGSAGDGWPRQEDAGADPPAPGEGDSEHEPATLGEAIQRIENLRTDLAEKEKQLSEAHDRLLRERAEVENFKRRMQRDKAEALRYASEPLVRDLLPVLDNLERAVSAAAKARAARTRRPEVTADVLESLVTGVELVLRQLNEALTRWGVSRVEAKEQAFDPNQHEALALIETSEKPAGSVLDEHASGYRLHDRLLRPAQVTVAKAPPDRSE